MPTSARSCTCTTKACLPPKIRLKGKNLQGKRPSKDLVNTTIKNFSRRGFGGRKFRYGRCGRKAWKMTPEVKKFRIQKLLVLRKRVVTTCVSLQLALAREKGISHACTREPCPGK